MIAHDALKNDMLEFVKARLPFFQAHFFRDPLTAQPHEPDVSALLRVCDVHNVPLATNKATADAVVRWMADNGL